MNYKEARVYLDETAKYGSVLGLENMRELLKRLGNPQDRLKFIHIAGTNGKGSVSAYLAATLKMAGYVVGRYISPTLFSYRERIQVGEAYIKRDALARLVTTIAQAITEMIADGKPHPTIFEVETVLGFLYFEEENCDIVVLETGLGGELDATNVVRTSVMEVITPIGMDHMGFLGNSLSEIASSKAGIIKENTVVVSAQQKPAARDVIASVCQAKRCSLYIADVTAAEDVSYGYKEQRFSYGGYRDLEITLAGVHQIQNAVIAVEAVHRLKDVGFPVSKQQLRDGLRDTVWNGRFTVIGEEPLFLIDGAHNRDAAIVLKESLKMYFTNRKVFYIMGVFKDKEYEEIVKLTVPLAKHVITIQTPDKKRAMSAKSLAQVVRKYHDSVESAETIEAAVFRSLAMAGKDDVIVAFGSLSFLGEITKARDFLRSEGK